jgi:hypothetical protein
MWCSVSHVYQYAKKASIVMFHNSTIINEANSQITSNH